MIVFVLTNFDTTIEQDLERVYTLRDIGYDPYIMVYDKEHTNSKDKVRQLQRWVNNRKIFKTIKNFEDYNKKLDICSDGQMRFDDVLQEM